MSEFLEKKNEAEPQIWFYWRTLVPLTALGLVIVMHLLIPTHHAYRPKVLPWFSRFLFILIAVFAVLSITSVFYVRLRKWLAFKSPFLGVGFLLLGLYNLITIKLNLVPSIYFPAPERIIGVFINDWLFLLQCLVYSLRLLLGGFFLGAFVGVLTGTLIGWSQRWNYWIMPFIRIVGPIPSTAWIPIALVIFFKPTDASLFLIALGVWFPTTVLTSSGIINVQKSYFEVSSTL